MFRVFEKKQREKFKYYPLELGSIFPDEWAEIEDEYRDKVYEIASDVYTASVKEIVSLAEEIEDYEALFLAYVKVTNPPAFENLTKQRVERTRKMIRYLEGVL